MDVFLRRHHESLAPSFDFTKTNETIRGRMSKMLVKARYVGSAWPVVYGKRLHLMRDIFVKVFL